VPMMENVYSNAKCVLVWLGDATKESSIAFDFMHTIIGAENFDRLVEQELFAEQWVALESLMRWRWFTRSWIVQEIALAKDAQLYCGKDSIPWTDFCHVVGLFKLYHGEIKPHFLREEYNYSRNLLGEVEALGACQLVHITKNLFRKSNNHEIQRRLVTLECLVSKLTMFDAGREHDLVYAMIALAKDIRTPAQNSRSVDPDASPVATPREELHVELGAPVEMPIIDIARPNGEDISTSSKKRKVHHLDVPRSPSVLRFQTAVRHAQRTRLDAFPVDYDQSFMKVCADFVEFVIKRSNSLDIILRSWVPEALRDKHRLPSWLMTLGTYPFQSAGKGAFVRVTGDPLVGLDPMEPKRYSACGQNAQPLRIDRYPTDGWGFCCLDRPSLFHPTTDPEVHDHRSLFANGFIYDTIASLRDKAVDGTLPTDWFEFGGWKQWTSSPPEPLWRTLLADRESNGYQVETFYSKTFQSLVKKHCAPRGGLNVKKILATTECDKPSERFLDRVMEVTPNRRLFKTTPQKDSLLGLAPANAEKGDLVCILYGCSVPVILRRHSRTIEGQPCEYFELVGDAYVHGLMDGHAVEENEQSESENKSQQFELR